MLWVGAADKDGDVDKGLRPSSVKEAVPDDTVHPLSLGDAVQARYQGRGKWYGGKVTAVRGSLDDGSLQYDVTYGDGELDAGLEPAAVRLVSKALGAASTAEPAFKVGDRVEARYNGRGDAFHGGWVTAVHEHAGAPPSYGVQYDIGEVEVLPAVHVRLQQPNAAAGDAADSSGGGGDGGNGGEEAEAAEVTPFAVGDEVLARFGGRGKYFAATVAAVHGSGASATYDVAYTDGDFDEGVKAGWLKPRVKGAVRGDAAAAASSAAAPATAGGAAEAEGALQVGDEVLCRFGGRGKQYAGNIAAVHGTGDAVTYTVTYKDGDEDEGVKPSWVTRRQKNVLTPHNLAVSE